MAKLELTGVVLEYSDGTVGRPDKCAVFMIGGETDSTFELTSRMLNFSGKDFVNLAYGISSLFSDMKAKTMERVEDELINGSSSEDPVGMSHGEVLE